ncbi:hypothetical protein BD779DRAFT_251779 [Infundibulicybe gibba]|nr:hypothetical protein BD779DRAFT_251779 [Infundibulicybe gibba]
MDMNISDAKDILLHGYFGPLPLHFFTTTTSLPWIERLNIEHCRRIFWAHRIQPHRTSSCGGYGLSHQILIMVLVRLLGGMVTVATALFILACRSLFSQRGTAAQPMFGCYVGLSYDRYG